MPKKATTTYNADASKFSDEQKALDAKAIAASVESKALSVSDAIRLMYVQGNTLSAIAAALDKRYQHVRNVLTEPLKKAK